MLDLLDPKLVSKVVTAKPRRRTARDREEDFERADDGRMIVEDESEEEREREKKRMRGGDVEMADAGDNQDYYTEAITGESAFERNEGGRVKFGSGKKRGRAAESFDEDMEGTASGKKQGWTEAQQRAFNMKHGAKKAKLLDDPDVARMLGKQYKAKKAAGDVKRPDMPDPHAYIPLSSKIVGNKRKGVKAASTFKKIVGAAQRGVKKATQFKVKAGGRGKR